MARDVVAVSQVFDVLSTGEAEDTRRRKAMIEVMEPRILRVSDADAVRDLAAVLQRVQAGREVVIERDAQPLSIIGASTPERRTISECIALAEAHEEESGDRLVLDPDFAADVEEIVCNRKPWNPPTWG